jgi:S-adenosylmethionine synthetase
MGKGRYLFTSESVTEGHPDKIADQVSDAILDGALSQDPSSRVAIETLVTTGVVFVAGEMTTNASQDIPTTVRETVRDIGYTKAEFGFDCNTCSVITAIDKQSPDIAMGVDSGGAGDQGMMFGFACRETDELMPLSVQMAHRLVQRLSEVRRGGELPYLRPDGKAQVTVEYVDGRPARLDAVVVSTQHAEEVSTDQLRRDVEERVLQPVIQNKFRDSRTHVHINPTGRFVTGGPQGDTGLTGRKIIVDTYGGAAHHGGGAFSGKDPTKVDRSAAYMARYIAKNLVAAGIAERLEVQIAYAIGVADPVSVMVHTADTGRISDQEIVRLIRDEFGLKPLEIIKELDLRRPIYRRTAAFGHFGRNDPDFTWERTDRAEGLRRSAKL